MSGSTPRLRKNTAGNRVSNKPGPAAHTGVLPDIRRMAALMALEKKKSSAGNKISNSPGHAPANTKRIGNVKAPAKMPGDENTGSFEGTPPFAKESLSGDGWTKAAMKAKQMFAAKK